MNVYHVYELFFLSVDRNNGAAGAIRVGHVESVLSARTAEKRPDLPALILFTESVCHTQRVTPFRFVGNVHVCERLITRVYSVCKM